MKRKFIIGSNLTAAVITGALALNLLIFPNVLAAAGNKHDEQLMVFEQSSEEAEATAGNSKPVEIAETEEPVLQTEEATEENSLTEREIIWMGIGISSKEGAYTIEDAEELKEIVDRALIEEEVYVNVENLADLIESSPDIHASIIDPYRISSLQDYEDAEFAVKEELLNKDQKLLQVLMSPEFVEKIIKQNSEEHEFSFFSKEIDGKEVRILTVQP